MEQKIYTKDSLIKKLLKIRASGWIEIKRNEKNVGSIGNTLEDLLDIKENNLPLPNAAEWELKTQRKNTKSYLTLFHMEPSPRALKLVPYLLANFGWPHKEAGKKYGPDEKSFRQTLTWHKPSIRGFDVDLEEENRKVALTFNFELINPSGAKKIADKQKIIEWKNNLVEKGLTRLDPAHTPYWGYDDLFHTAGMKLKNCFFVVAETKRVKKITCVHYKEIMMLSNFRIEKMIAALKNRDIFIDFDARTGHNHGTKFRIKPQAFPTLYQNVDML